MLALALARGMPALADEPAGFVGAQVCAGCHAAEAERWEGSHHALAMQQATPATVLGDFSDARLDHFGVVTSFSRSGDKFMVRTDGPDGALHDYQIAYTFGALSAAAVSDRVAGRPASGARHRLGQPAEGAGRAALVPPLPGPEAAGGRSAALDRARPDLELPVRRLPLHRARRRTSTWRQQLCDHLVRRGRVVRGLPRAGLASRRLGASHAGAAVPTDADRLGLTNWLKPTDQGHWEMNPRDRHRQAHRAARLGGGRRLRRMPFAAQGDREGRCARRAFSRFLSSGAARAGPLPRRRPDRRRGVRIWLVPAKPHASCGRHLFGLP